MPLNLRRGNFPNDHANADSWYVATGKLNDYAASNDSLRSDTINAGDIKYAAATFEASIALADADCISQGKTLLYIPLFMLPYDITLCPASAGVRRIREGGDSSVYDVLAYGATGDFVANDTPAFVSALTAATAQGGAVVVPCKGQVGYGLGASGAASATACLEVRTGVTLQGTGGNQLIPVLRLLAGTNLSMIEVPGAANQGAKIERLRLEGNSANQSGTSHGIHCVSTGAYIDSRSSFSDLFVHDFRTNGVRTDANFGQSVWDSVVVRNNLAENWLLHGADAVYVNCQSNDAGTDGFYITGQFHYLFGCIGFNSGSSGFHIGSSGKYNRLIGCDSDTNDLDNYNIDADCTIMSACTSRDPGQLTDNTYAHIDIASGLTGLNIQGTEFIAKTETNTALYLIRCNGALTNCIIEAASWETGAANNGVALLGTLTNVTMIRPPGQQTFASGDATPSVSGRDKFNNISTFATSGTTAITAFDDGQDGQIIMVLATGNITITQGATINLQGGVNFAMVNGNTLTLGRISSVWREMARKT